jgi:hypothetical protein
VHFMRSLPNKRLETDLRACPLRSPASSAQPSRWASEKALLKVQPWFRLKPNDRHSSNPLRQHPPG